MAWYWCIMLNSPDSFLWNLTMLLSLSICSKMSDIREIFSSVCVVFMLILWENLWLISRTLLSQNFRAHRFL